MPWRARYGIADLGICRVLCGAYLPFEDHKPFRKTVKKMLKKRKAKLGSVHVMSGQVVEWYYQVEGTVT